MIGSAWLEVLDRVLRPARPCLSRCLAAREAHAAKSRARAGVALRALARCERRIEEARTGVFRADDGVVGRRMTELEREWRRLSSPDADAGLMDLWAEVAPTRWIDRKRFRDSRGEAMLDALVALAADPDGVEEAERAAGALRTALLPHGVALGSKVVWRSLGDDRECLASLLSARTRVARSACPSKIEARIMERAESVAEDVRAVAVVRHPGRPLLAADLGAAARLDFVWQAAALAEADNPVVPLRALYRTGYVLAAADASSVTLAFPPVG